MKKICSKCKIEKEFTEFSKDKYRKDGFTSECKECRNQRKTEYRATNEGAIKTKNYRILRRLKPEVKQREKERHIERRKTHKRTLENREYFYKKRDHIYELRKQRDENYFKVGKKVYFGKVLGKIKEVIYRKGCLVELENGMKMWLAKYRLKPFKKLSEMKKSLYY